MKFSVEEAEMYAAELREGYMKAMRRPISLEQAARGYLKNRNWDFTSWDLEVIG